MTPADEQYWHSQLEAALRLHRSGELAAAETSYRTILAGCPTHAVVWNLLGALCHAQGRSAEAVPALARAVALQPQQASFLANLAEVKRTLGALDEALALAEQALRLAPDMAESYHKLGLVLADLGRSAEALALYERTVELNPRHAEALQNWGCELVKQERPAEALPLFQASLQLAPHSALGENNLGAALSLSERADEALVHYRRALELDPTFRAAHSNRLFASNYEATLSAEQLSALHFEYGRRFCTARCDNRWTQSRVVERPLRIGYFTPDTCRHPVAFFLRALLRQHDRTNYPITIYSDATKHDDLTDALRQVADRWVTTRGWSDRALLEHARNDALDIAVDLAGHTTGNRLGAFAERLAPIQVSYLGYVNTTGVPQIDYRLTDAICDPPDDPPRYVEQLVHLPRHFSAYVPYADAPTVSPLPALRNGYVTFGSLHNLSKLGAATLALWARVLRQLPTARLRIVRRTLTPEISTRLQAAFAALGVEPRQLEFVSTWHEPTHLYQYDQIDLALDVVPWSGHTTACEALWQGVPIVTLAGNRYAGRMVASVLTALGLPEGIARSEAEFAAIATAWAQDLPRLAHWRAHLRTQMAHSPLGDGASLARAVEQAYREMWRRWCAST